MHDEFGMGKSYKWVLFPLGVLAAGVAYASSQGLPPSSSLATLPPCRSRAESLARARTCGVREVLACACCRRLRIDPLGQAEMTLAVGAESWGTEKRGKGRESGWGGVYAPCRCLHTWRVYSDVHAPRADG